MRVLFILLVYVPILWHTVQFLLSDLSTEETHIENVDTYTVHQIFIPFGPMPEDWKECSESWDTFHVVRWDKTMCQEAIMMAMPNRRELLDYEGVMFTDVCRAAIMYVQGGIYADMDICAKRDITFPECDACFVKTSVGVSNDLIISKKKHPVFLNVLQQYADYAWVDSWFYLPYIREMFSTGPVRFTLATHKYPNTKVISYDNMDIVHIDGNTWHSWDAILFMHPWILVLVGVAYVVYTRRKKLIKIR